jgi:hypothetical protein
MLIGRLFEAGASMSGNLPVSCAEAHQFAYDPSDYGRLAKALGYAPVR